MKITRNYANEEHTKLSHVRINFDNGRETFFRADQWKMLKTVIVCAFLEEK